MKRAIILACALALAACGLREPLTTEQMLTPPPIARPDRVDELLRRSEERRDDRFDLPPGDVPVPDSEDDEPE